MKKSIQMRAKLVINRENLPSLLKTDLADCVTVDDNYRIRPQTLLVYDFKADPIAGQVQAVAFDQEKGVVLLRNMTTRSLFYQVYKTASERELTVKKYLARCLGVTGQHVQAFGSYAYFSFAALRQNFLDVVSLHQMLQFECVGSQGCFLTKDRQYAFEIQLPARAGAAWTMLQDAITLNAACLELLKLRAREWGCSLKPNLKKCLLTDPAYYRTAPVKALNVIDLNRFYHDADQQLLDLYSDSFYHEFAEEFNDKCWKKGDMYNLLAKCSRNYVDFK